MQNKTEEIVIVGAGETAELAYEYFTCDSPYAVAGFAVEKEYLKHNELFGLPVVALDAAAARYDTSRHRAFVAVSYTQLNRVRTRLYRQVKAMGYGFVSYVSSKAFVWRNVEIGENCFILEQNVIQYGAKVGNNVTLWSGNHIGHRSRIADNCFISSHVVVSGYCEVGENCFLGVNSSMGDNVKVSFDCVIGAGAVVLHDTEPKKIYRGNPAAPARVDSLTMFGLRETKR
jgi:sugar O-acyltransferase (sialic acid O-acetyltransferase NeuD family)